MDTGCRRCIDKLQSSGSDAEADDCNAVGDKHSTGWHQARLTAAANCTNDNRPSLRDHRRLAATSGRVRNYLLHIHATSKDGL